MQRRAILEEKIEFSNATRFRKLLLNVLDRLQENHYLRYVITKRGEPKAVVMSFYAYETIKRALNQLLDSENRITTSESTHNAFDQMAQQFWPEVTGRSRPAGPAREEETFEMRKTMKDLLDAADRLKKEMEQADRASLAVMGHKLAER